MKDILYKYDINRNYHYIYNKIIKENHYINKFIIDYIINKEIDLIIDMHEARNFRKITKKSMGNMLVSNNYNLSNNIGKYLKKKINKTIKNKNKKFVFSSKIKTKKIH